MDVRCEKCQTEYELDESRLKPGGVTVKCTNCGHMFKIRKRTITNVGITAVGGPVTGGPMTGGPTMSDAATTVRPRPNSSRPLPSIVDPARRNRPASPVSLGRPPGDPLFDDEARTIGADEAPTTVDRQWLIRLENGEQKSCRELATLQQWIVAGVVTRESLISRSGKTWKRLGDVADLGQYFAIADEARANRERFKPPTPSPGARGGPIASIKELPGTLPGYGGAQAAGGTIVPDDDDGPEARTTRAPHGRGVANTPPPLPARGGGARTPAPPPSPVHVPVPRGLGPTEPAPLPTQGMRRPRTTPPPPPAMRGGGPPAIPLPQGNRATAMWATDGVKPEASDLPASGASGPFVGKLAAIPDEPAFAGRVRMSPSDAGSFESAKLRAAEDDDDDLLPARRGSRAGMWVLIIALLAMGGAAAAVYLFVIRGGRDEPVARPAADAGSATAVAVVPPDAPPVQVDAAVVEPVAPEAGPRSELLVDLEPRLCTAAQALDAKLDAPSQALRAHLIAQLAQDLLDRAALTPSPAGDGLRKEAKQLVLDAATSAQRAFRAAGDDPGANIAMAEILRLQGKPGRDIKRYLDTARARPDKDWARDLALADAMLLVRDGKPAEAGAAFAAIDQGDGKLETSGDVRARFHLALALAAQGKTADARPLVATILAARPEHAAARALAAKLETLVATTDPLPPEATPDGAKTGGTRAGGTKDGGAKEGAKTADISKTTSPAPTPGGDGGGGESYDRLLARANAVADSSCGKAMELYAKALEQKPNGVEALAGMGYCHIDAKQFASAFSKFRAALAVSPRYEPALRGIAEAYQQQGRKEQAIEAYKAYLEAYPNSVAAKKQLERLGGDAQAPAPPAASTAPPPPAPTPSPSPPAPDPAGAGSGSG